MREGFQFAIGFVIGLVLMILAIICAVGLVKAFATPRKVKKELWMDYLDECIEDDEFEECRFVTELLETYIYADRIPLPKGYTLKTEHNVVVDDDEDMGRSVFRLDKRQWIEKKFP